VKTTRAALLVLSFVAVPVMAAAVDARIARVENGLLPPLLIAGEPLPRMKLAERMRAHGTPAVSIAVIHNGAIEWARGYGVTEGGGTVKVTPETLFEAASISKPVAAMAAMRLVEEQRLALDEEVNRRLVSWKIPEAEVTRERKITLRQLLSHTAGVGGYGYRGYAPGEPLPSLVDMLEGRPPANSEPVRPERVPGAELRYSGGGYLIVQQLLSDVTGRSFAAVARDLVLRKLGMTHSTFEQPLPPPLRSFAAWGHDESGALMSGKWRVQPELAAAGLWTTPSDLARLAIEVQRVRSGKPPRAVSRATIDEMLTPQSGGWGLGFELHGSGRAFRFGHSGSVSGYRSILVAYANIGEGAVVMTNSDDGAALAAEILRAIAREYGWPDYGPHERVILPSAPATHAQYAGRYELGPGFVATVKSEGDKLVAEAPSRPKVELLRVGEDAFVIRELEADVVFRRDASGRVNALVLIEDGQETVAPRLP
jgi:CubicO group peptidase (beta-lactamase class C family)